MNIKAKKKNSTLRGKLIRYFLIIIILMFFVNIFSMQGFKSHYKKSYVMLRQLVDIHLIAVKVDTLHQYIENYAYSGLKEYIFDYRQEFEKLEKDIQEFENNSNGRIYDNFRDIHYMLLTFNEKSEEIIKKYDQNMHQIYIVQSIDELTKTKSYIKDEVKNVLLTQLLNVESYFEALQKGIKKEHLLLNILTAFVTLLCLVFAFDFSDEISVPIHQLVLNLQTVAAGKLEVDKIRATTNNEINILIEAFDTMVVRIKKLIEKIKEKADVEKKLKQQEIKNLEMLNLLSQAELDLLQSQINPHFLFNTLNSIAVLADIEEAEQTKVMLESMSDILRYNLKKLNTDVTLREEYEIVKNYIYIQKVRFGNRIQYVLNIDENVMDYVVPSMILQPFVENAIIHGLEPKEGSGVLELNIIDKSKYIEICIKDDGLGISADKLKDLLDHQKENKVARRGIGISNVLRRLEIKYGRNVVDIFSEEGVGTKVSMRLYRN